MTGFFDRLLGRASGKGSGSTAKERLQFILVHDRINLPPERLQAMKEEILQVISKYVSVDSENVDIALQKRRRDSLLVAEIPFSKTTEDIEQDDPDYRPPAPVAAEEIQAEAEAEAEPEAGDDYKDTDKKP
jgi:cell division topological specificity factor